MRGLIRTALAALITLAFSTAAFAQYSQPVRVVNTTDQAVPVKDAGMTTSSRGVILAGATSATVEPAVPTCPAGATFLVTGLHVAPEIMIGATSINVTQLPYWGASLWTWQKTTWGGYAVGLNVLGHGPQHLSATLPAGQPVLSTKATTYIQLLGGVTAPARFEFNVHVTGHCGIPFSTP